MIPIEIVAQDLLTLSGDQRRSRLKDQFLTGQEAQQLLMTFMTYLVAETYDRILMLDIIRDLLPYVENQAKGYLDQVKQIKAAQIDPLSAQANSLLDASEQARQTLRDLFLLSGTKAASGFLLVEAEKPTYILPDPASPQYTALAAELERRDPALVKKTIQTTALRQYLQQKGDTWIAEYGVEAELKAHIRLT